MARTTDISTRLEEATRAALAVLTGVECRRFDDNTDDDHTHCAVKVEKDREELPGTGVWLCNVFIRLRNFTSAQILAVENYFRDSCTARNALATAGADEFLLPAGNAAVTLASSQRTGDGADKEHYINLQITAQPHEVGISV